MPTLARFTPPGEYVQATKFSSGKRWRSGRRGGADAKASLEIAARLNASEAPVFNALGGTLEAIGYFEKACALAQDDEAFQRNLDLARKR